jgi:hypothetical protein
MSSKAFNLQRIILSAVVFIVVLASSGSARAYASLKNGLIQSLDEVTDIQSPQSMSPIGLRQTLENRPPIPVPGGPYSGQEGRFLTFDGSGSSDPEGGALIYEWLVNGQMYSGATVDVFFDDNFVGQTTLTVTDEASASASSSAQVIVTNVNPIVEAFIDYQLSAGDEIILQNVTFFDPGRADTHTASIDWGDGSAIESGDVTEANGNGEVFGSHTFNQGGSFTVEICVEDDDGGEGCDTFAVTVLAPPTSTPTPTPIPDDQLPVCPELTLSDPRFRRDNFRVDITNLNPTETFTLTSVVLYWPEAAETLDWMKLDKTVIWNGNDSDPPTNTDLEPYWRGGANTVFRPGDDRRFDVDFDHPGDLDRFADIEDFFGTTFIFAEGCQLMFGDPPAPPPYVPPEYPACPTQYDLLGQYTDQLRRDKDPMFHDVPFTLENDAQIWINGWVKEGHPERGCPVHPTCNQNQQHEDVVIEIDDQEIGVYEDSEHGPDENAWYPSGPFEAGLVFGPHKLTFRHSMHGSGPQSVNYLYSVCVRSGNQTFFPIVIR